MAPQSFLSHRGGRGEVRTSALAAALCALTLAACGGAAAPAASSASAPASPSTPAAASKPASAAAAKPATSSAAAKPAASPAASGLTPVLIGYPGVNMGDAQEWVATEGHIWEKHGLAADVRNIGSSAATVAALISNQAQFIQVGGSDAVSAKVAGADVVVLAVPIPTYSYILETPASIKTPQDLKGKKLAVDSYGSPPDVAIRVALRKDGLDPDKDVSIVAVGDVPTRTAALISGAVQGTMLNPPYSLDVEKKGYHPLIDLAALHLPYANAAPQTLRSYAAAHKDIVQDYVDAFVEANNRVRHDKAFTEQAMSKYMKITDQEALDATYDYYSQKIFPAVPEARPELFKDAIDQLATKNPAVKGFDASTIIDGAFLKSAVDRGLVQQ
jgi:NitT/TauT family transport system substrate-binding protein